MKYNIQARQSGKTTAAIKTFIAKPQSILLVADQVRKDHVVRMMEHHHVDEKDIKARVFTLMEWKRSSTSRILPKGKLLIDEAGWVFEQLFGTSNIEIWDTPT